jgi:predicted nucleotidyltransferase
MNATLAGVTVERMREEGIVPDDCVCAFLSGSIVAGWGNATSDLDIYVVSASVPNVAATGSVAHFGDPPTVPILVRVVGDSRWDVEFWLESQVDQVVEKVTATELDGERPAGLDFTPDDKDFLYRLSIGLALIGEDWLRSRRETIEAARYPTIVATVAFSQADGYVEDALGQLEAGDDVSAVLSARIAFDHAVDGLLATKGELAPNPKWRARKLLRAQPSEISWDDYWEVETMQRFDPANPAAWVRGVIERCQELMLEVDLS